MVKQNSKLNIITNSIFSFAGILAIIFLSGCKSDNYNQNINIDQKTLLEIEKIAGSFFNALEHEEIGWIIENTDPDLINRTGVSVEWLAQLNIGVVRESKGIRNYHIESAIADDPNADSIIYRVGYYVLLADGTETFMNFFFIEKNSRISIFSFSFSH